MSTLIVAILSFVGFIIAYHTYGKWLSKKIFDLDEKAIVPSKELEDGVDFVPTKKSIIFGHHFTSIAGTGPIVGPAIAVFWGWLPALLWVVFGSIFIGAVHDFGALIVSLRNRGQTVGEVAGRLINPRAKILFLLILFFALTIVLAIFGLVIATIFKIYPESVLPVWISLPVAIIAGIWIYRHGGSFMVASAVGLVIVYFCIYLGAYHLPISIPDFSEGKTEGFVAYLNPIVIWTILLLVYCFFASVLPVWLLLQPRDVMNSHQLILALGLLIIGLAVAAFSGQADIASSAPMRASSVPIGAPPIWPFLFITIACGAVSGFHCLVSSGTSSKQVQCEPDAQFVGYGSMLLEGALAVIVIIACCAGLGMGKFEKVNTDGVTEWVAKVDQAGEPIVGQAAFETLYNPNQNWTDFNLGKKVGAFIEGGANFLAAIGIPLKLGIGIIAVLVACFAATTLDTATRLQRYVIQELAVTCRIKPLENKYMATLLAVVLGAWIAMIPSAVGKSPGTGGLILWPLFGATNQLLAGLAFMVTCFYLWRRKKPVYFALIPMVIMIILPGWALLWQMFNENNGFFTKGKYFLFAFSCGILALQLWMVVEAAIMWPKVKGVLEKQLPPLTPLAKPSLSNSAGSMSNDSGRSC